MYYMNYRCSMLLSQQVIQKWCFVGVWWTYSVPGVLIKAQGLIFAWYPLVISLRNGISTHF